VPYMVALHDFLPSVLVAVHTMAMLPWQCYHGNATMATLLSLTLCLSSGAVAGLNLDKLTLGELAVYPWVL